MRALIIDDEPYVAEYLNEMIQQHCYEIDSTHLIHSPIKAIEHLKEVSYDIVFLDVEMPEINGFELLERVNLKSQTQVIFTTSFSQYAVDAFKVNAAHYLVKMVKKDELVDAVRKASYFLKKKSSGEEESVISVYSGEEYHIIKHDNILRLKSSGSYTSIVVQDGDFLSTKSLGTYESLLPSKKFVRCHNSHIVNKKYVSKVNKGKSGYLVLENKDVVPIATSRRDAVIKMLGL